MNLLSSLPGTQPNFYLREKKLISVSWNLSVRTPRDSTCGGELTVSETVTSHHGYRSAFPGDAHLGCGLKLVWIRKRNEFCMENLLKEINVGIFISNFSRSCRCGLTDADIQIFLKVFNTET